MTERLARVRGFLLDMDGTFYLGDRLLQGALHFIEVLSAQNKDYLFLTNNSSKHRREYAEKIGRLGLGIPETKVFTSGEAAALYLQTERPGARVFVVGTPSLMEEFGAHGFRPVTDDPDLILLGFDTTVTYERLWKLCDFVRRGLPYIATHADFSCPTETGFMPDVGSIMALVQASTDASRTW